MRSAKLYQPAPAVLAFGLSVSAAPAPDEPSFPTLKRLLLGKPIPSHLAHHERLSRVTGLAVLSSDALSSVAYATDFIVATLIVAGTGALVYAIPIGVVIALLLTTVAFSYRQTIYAYPTGGGAYLVAKENIGENAGIDGSGVAARRLHAHRVGEHFGRGARQSRRRCPSWTLTAWKCAWRSSRF